MTGAAESLLSAGAALAVVLLLIVAAGRLIRIGSSTPRAKGGRAFLVQETVALDPRRRLHLIHCGSRRVLLLTGGAQDLVVGWIPDGDTI